MANIARRRYLVFKHLLNMSINFSKLVDLRYLSETPSTTIQLFWPLIVVLAVSLVSAIIFWRLARRQAGRAKHVRKLFTSLAIWLGYPAIIGFVLLFFRNQGIIYLSWRLWSEILSIVWLGGIVGVIFHIILKFPKEKREYELHALKQKYIPQPKKFGGQIGDKNS